MSTKEVRLLWAVLVVAVILVAIFILRQESSYTGSLVGIVGIMASPEVSREKIWDFALPADYAYDTSKINLSGGEAKLIPSVSTQTTSTTTTVEITLSSATVYEEDDGEIESEDGTSKVTSLGQGNVQLKDGKKVLGVTFPQNLKNSDVFSVYLLNGSVGKLYVCASSAGCTSAEHGELSLNSGEEGWRNITVSSLNSPKTTFYLDSPALNPSDKMKVDMLKGYNITVSEETTTTTTYPASAALETADLQPTDLKRWNIFTKTETLNGQQIDYAYSANSGSSWSAMPLNGDSGNTGDLSVVTATKLRVQATLNSNGSATPILKSMKLNYTTQQPCTENWTTAYGACLISNLQLKWYLDQNDCGTKTSLPADNGTFVSCDYCTPSWTALNGSCSTGDAFTVSYFDLNGCYTKTGLAEDLQGRPANLSWSCDFCTPTWTPQNTSCTPGDAFTTWHADPQNCYAQTGLASDLATKPANLSQACNYCNTHDCRGSFETFLNSSQVLNSSTALNFTTWLIDAREKTKAKLEITVPNSTGEAEGKVTIIEYNQSRVNSTPRTSGTQAIIDLKKQVEINSSIANVTAVKIILYYTDEELQQAGIDENTIKIHYYNDSYYNESSGKNGQWQELPSIVNATENYVYAVVEHLSLYGLFGQGIPEEGGQQESSSASSSSSGGGGGSGGGSSGGGAVGSSEPVATLGEVPVPAGQAKEVVQPVLEAPTTALASAEEATVEQPCNYVVEVTLPDQVSFLENNAYESEIENKGDCVISRLELQLSPELQPVLELPIAALEAVKPGDKHSFTLIRKQSRREKMFSVITTLATVEEIGTEEVTGLLLLSSQAEDKTVYARELPLRVEVPAPLKITSLPVIKMGIAIVLFLLVLAAVHWDKEERQRLSRWKGEGPWKEKRTGRKNMGVRR